MKTQHNSAIQHTEKYITENALDAGTNVHTKQTYCRDQRHIIHQTKCTSGARQKDRKTERQKDRKTERQKDRETERQTNTRKRGLIELKMNLK